MHNLMHVFLEMHLWLKFAFISSGNDSLLKVNNNGAKNKRWRISWLLTLKFKAFTKTCYSQSSCFLELSTLRAWETANRERTKCGPDSSFSTINIFKIFGMWFWLRVRSNPILTFCGLSKRIHLIASSQIFLFFSIKFLFGNKIPRIGNHLN